jgi:alkylhydroperoxidase family enzyme
VQITIDSGDVRTPRARLRYSRTAAVFSERELGQVIAMALTINAWNRIGVTTRLPLPRR